MYCGSCGLGEILPDGHLYSLRDPAAAGTVAQVTSLWQSFLDGNSHGANFDAFQEAVALGWVPYTPEGYDRFQWYFTGGSPERKGLPEFTGWLLAWIFSHSTQTPAADVPALALSSINAAVSNGDMSDAERQVAVEAFNRFWPLYLARFNPTATATAPIPDMTGAVRNQLTGVLYPVSEILYAGPNPLDPQGTILGEPSVMFQLKTGQTWTWSGTWTGPVIGTPNPPQSLIDAYANITAQQEQARLQARVLSAHTYEIVVRPSNSVPGSWVQIAQRDTYHFTDGSADVSHWTVYDVGTPLTWAEQIARPDVTSVLKSTELTPAEWQAILDDFAASGIAPQTLVPFIPGSTVNVPAPGTGGEPTVTLPGTTTPIPVSQLPPAIVAPETAGQSTPYQSPATAAPTTPAASVPAGSSQPPPDHFDPYVPPGSQPGGYATPGGGYVSPTPPAEGAPVVQAGIPGGLLIGGGILVAALLLGSKRGRRPRGYRRY